MSRGEEKQGSVVGSWPGSGAGHVQRRKGTDLSCTYNSRKGNRSTLPLLTNQCKKRPSANPQKGSPRPLLPLERESEETVDSRDNNNVKKSCQN